MARRSGALTIGSGIFASRLLGLLRDRALAHYFGVSPLADVFGTALRGPNIIQNLLGEQALSAAFIPVYSRLLGAGRNEEAGRFAGAIFGLLLAATSAVVLTGVLLARPIVSVLVPGYLGDADAVAAGTAAIDRYELAVVAVRWVFPMAGFAVLAAWCLGVLNSHRRFLLPYFAPVLWNGSIIAALLWVGTRTGPSSGQAGVGLLYAGCAGALVGGFLQFVVQLPLVLRLLRGFRVSLSIRVAGVREALGRFGPALAGRGVVQVSNYLDLFLASFLVAGAVGALGWAQRLYALPVSLFGLAIAAAELPELARATSGEESTTTVVRRLHRAWRQMVFLTVPTVVGYLAFGYLIVGAIYRTGEFTASDSWLVYAILVAYTVGLLATTTSRLLQNTFYAYGDTATPAKIAVARLTISGLAGALLMVWLDRYTLTDVLRAAPPGDGLHLGPVGLALAAGAAGWLELVLLRRRVTRRIPLALPWRFAAQQGMLAAIPALVAATLWWLLAGWPPLVLAPCVVGLYGVGYLGGSAALGVGEARRWLSLRNQENP